MGPMAGTLAAQWMATITAANDVGVVTGSAFAALQALGMTVTAFSPLAAVWGGGAGVYFAARNRSMLLLTDDFFGAVPAFEISHIASYLPAFQISHIASYLPLEGLNKRYVATLEAARRWLNGW
jgi:hypothetical protein